MGEDRVPARVGYLLFDLCLYLVVHVHPSLGQLRLGRGMVAVLQWGLDRLVGVQWRVEQPAPRLAHD